uniref:immunoglobulin superfamily member 11-like isoform X3 n=1 Tax=Myxine glutinosa TaxID=7769 RepID=UPI00358EB916
MDRSSFAAKHHPLMDLWVNVAPMPYKVCALRQKSVKISPGQFHGRAVCFGNGTLHVNNSQAMDSGFYSCLESRMLSPQPQTFASFNVSVYSRPTGPSCRFEGEVVPRGNVSLTCEGATGWPNVTYGWLGADGERVSNCIGGRCGIYGLSLAHDGTYTCLVTNAFGNSTCNISLKLPETRRPDNAERLYTILAVSFTIVFILILICLAFIFRRRRRKQSRMYARPSMSRQPSQPTAPVDIHEDGLTYAELDFSGMVLQDHATTWQLKK